MVEGAGDVAAGVGPGHGTWVYTRWRGGEWREYEWTPEGWEFRIGHWGRWWRVRWRRCGAEKSQWHDVGALGYDGEGKGAGYHVGRRWRPWYHQWVV